MQITIKYPDDCTEYNAILYAEGCFNPKQHDYKRKEATGRKEATVLTFQDDRMGIFYRTKNGYVLELNETDNKWKD